MSGTELAPRVVHVISSISEEGSGPSYSVPRLCQSLGHEGFEVTLATLRAGDRWLDGAVDVKEFGWGLGPRRLGRSPRLYRWLRAERSAGRVQLIHNHGFWMMPNVYPGWVARRYRVPYVVSPRGTLSEWAFKWGSKVKRAFWPLVQRRALDSVACWHATGDDEYSDIRMRGFRQPVAVIPNGVDVVPYRKAPKSGPRTMLFASRIHPKKGLDMLLRAWGQVSGRFPEWRLRIAGPDDGGYLPDLQRLATELELDRVEFAGPLYGDAKLRAYQEAELFVLPTRSENFGMVVAEALGVGTPVIVTKGAPWAELQSRRAGWWIDIGVEPLVACLNTALRYTRRDLLEMGERGRQWMEAEYSWSRVGSMMAEVYRWLLRGSAPPPWVRTD